MRFGLLVLVCGCASVLSAPAPMHSQTSVASPAERAECALVFLPGFGDSDADFADHGFVAELRVRHLSVDVISANATIGYYAKRTVVDRLETDVFAAVRAKGYSQIWVMGISMGGLGTILVAQRYGRALAGLILFAPYLGDEDLIEEIRDAGGLARWQPPAHPDDYQPELWRWLKHALIESPATSPPIYLASGDQDPLAPAHRLLASAIQPGHLFRTRGNHDWGPWKKLWIDFLARSDFATRCGPVRTPTSTSP